MSWPLVKLGSIGEFKAGYGFPNKYQGETSGDMPFAKVGDISEVARHGGKYISEARNYINIDVLSQIKAKSVPVNTIVFAKIGEAIRQNFRAVTSVETVIDNNSMGLVPNLNLIDVDYLYHFMCKLDLYRYTGATTVPAIRKSTLEDIEIPLPPLEEQKRIAAILDKADAIRRKRQQAIQLADDFLRSVFLDMFGDPVTNPKGYPVNKLGTNCEDLFLGLTSKVDYVDGDNGYPLIRAKDINKGELSFNEVKYISETQHKKLTKNHLTRKGDLLVSKSGTLGTCAIVRTEREFSTYESIFTVRPDVTKINLHYLIHLLQNRGFKKKLIGNKVGGTVAHLNLKMFRDFEIGIPPLEIQNEFSVKIIKCEEKIEKYRQSAIEANLFFNSLTQKAFAGEL